MECYEEEVRALERTLREQRTSCPPTAFYGSSSIRMWEHLAADLKDSRALNVGFGGSTLAACVHFFERLIVPLDPASLVVYAGDNDLGDGRSPEDVLGSFLELVDRVKRLPAFISFGFISIKISPVRTSLRAKIEQTNALIRAQIERLTNAYYIDVLHAMLDSSGQPRPELFLEDGLHLSRAGYRLWTELLEPYRNRIFTLTSQKICT